MHDVPVFKKPVYTFIEPLRAQILPEFQGVTWEKINEPPDPLQYVQAASIAYSPVPGS